jgi:hypothetical protein
MLIYITHRLIDITGNYIPERQNKMNRENNNRYSVFVTKHISNEHVLDYAVTFGVYNNHQQTL